jgi:hypothetical protein
MTAPLTPDDLIASYLETGVLDVDAIEALPADRQAEVRATLTRLDRRRAALADPATWADPDPQLEDRVLAAIATEAAAGAPAAAVAQTRDPATGDGETRSISEPQPADDGAAAPLATVHSLEARAHRSRVIAIGASIAAAAAVVVALLAFSTRPPANTSAAPPDGTSLPKGQAFTLQATNLLPDATGTVRLEETPSGMAVYLDASGLPRRDDGEFYEAWVRTAHGLVPIGTFHTGADVTLWSGISMDQVQAITVSLEKDDNNQDSSGQRVLIAEIHPAAGTTTVPPRTAPS